MPSSPRARNRLIKQAAGENLNAWGTLLNSGLIEILDAALDGWTTKALTADVSLTSANYTADEARSRVLKFTGTGSYTVTIPSVEKVYIVWNALSGNLTITTGAGTTAVLPTGAITLVICDGSNVKPFGYGGYELKTYIDQAILATTGSLPATTGNEGKGLIVTGGAWVPTLLALANISDFAWASLSDVRAGSSSVKATPPKAMRDAQARQTLTDAASVAWNVSNGSSAVLTMTSGVGSSRAIAAPTGCQEGDDIDLRIIQPGSGGGTYTATFNAAFDFGDYGAPVLTTGNSKWCIVSGKVISVDGSGNATKIAASFWGGGS